MKRQLILASAVAIMLASAPFVSNADGLDKQLLGEPEPNTAAERVVVINPDTKYVNVTHGDIVEFIVANKPYTWDFDGSVAMREIDLNKVLPEGTLDHTVKVYVARNRQMDCGN